MIERLKQLAPRERLVLGIGTAAAILIIAWSFVWTPLRDGASDLDAEVAERSQQIVDLRRAANLSTSSALGTETASGASLVVLVAETAQPLGLAFDRTNPDGADAINVTFRDVRYDRLIGWLIDLEQIHGVAVVSASMSRTGNAGLINGTVRLDRS